MYGVWISPEDIYPMTWYWHLTCEMEPCDMVTPLSPPTAVSPVKTCQIEHQTKNFMQHKISRQNKYKVCKYVSSVLLQLMSSCETGGAWFGDRTNRIIAAACYCYKHDISFHYSRVSPHYFSRFLVLITIVLLWRIHFMRQKFWTVSWLSDCQRFDYCCRDWDRLDWTQLREWMINTTFVPFLLSGTRVLFANSQLSVKINWPTMLHNNIFTVLGNNLEPWVRKCSLQVMYCHPF